VLSSGLSWPDRRVTVNLAPPTHRKSGSGLDLAIAVGVLAAIEQIDAEALGGRGFAGELGLDGSLRAVAGVAPMVGVAPELEWVVPSASVGEASAVAVTEVRGVSSLTELVDVLAGVAPVAAAVAELLREGWLADEAGWLEVAVSGLPP
jgi:magnesium chelatase family protein